MQTLKFKSGKLGVQPPRYSEAFRDEMRRIGAEWQQVRLSGADVWMYRFAPEQLAAVEASFARCFPEATLGEVPQGPFAQLPPTIIPAIGVVASDGRTYAFIGGTFDAMQQCVKRIDGRQWDGAAKAWRLLHLDQANLVEIIAKAGFRLIPGESLPDEELRQIVAAQRLICEARKEIEARIAKLDAKVKSYSFQSTSHIKAGLARDRARLRYALEYAMLPIEGLTEPQIRTLLAVVREDLEG